MERDRQKYRWRSTIKSGVQKEEKAGYMRERGREREGDNESWKKIERSWREKDM